MINEISIWEEIETKAQLHQEEAIIGPLLQQYIFPNDNLWDFLSHLLAEKAGVHFPDPILLLDQFSHCLAVNSVLQGSILKDLAAYRQKDYSISSWLEIIFFANGFQGLLLQRLAHHFYLSGQTIFAKSLQQCMVHLFGMDIHPNVPIGHGVVIDHGIGLVIGETSTIGNNCFLFHNVTLGSTLKEGGDRHPKIQDEVLIGAGAILLGNITVGKGAKIAAGSVVMKDIPDGATVVGNPGRVV